MIANVIIIVGMEGKNEISSFNNQRFFISQGKQSIFYNICIFSVEMFHSSRVWRLNNFFYFFIS